MSKIKVLQVIGNLKIGGAENVAMNYYRYIDRSKFEFHYLVYDDNREGYYQEVYNLGGKVIHIDYKPKKIMEFYREFLKILKREKYDVVHSHTLFNSGVILHAAKIADIPRRIAHSHSTRNKVTSNYLLNIYEKLMRNLILNNATDLVACSKQAGFFLYGELNFRKKGKIVLNGVEVDKFMFNNETRSLIRKRLNLEQKIVLGHVGHLNEVKNQTFLLKVMDKLSSNRYVLLLIGEGSEESNLKEYAEEIGVSNQVIFLGSVNNVNDYLNAFDVFVFPSLYEGLPLSLIEAQANGLPCIISDRITDEIVLSNLVTKVSIENNIDKWKYLIKSSKRSLIPEKYAKIIKESGYDVIEVGKKIQEIYLS